MPSPTDAPYRLGRAEQRGQVLGLRPGQALAGATAAIALVVGVDGGGATLVLSLLVVGAAVAVAVVPWRGRGLDEWVPVVLSHWLTTRRGALCAGAGVMEAPVPHVRWPDGTATSFAAIAHRGLRALADEPRAHGEAIASWLRGLGAVGAPDWTVALVTRTGLGPAVGRDAPWAARGIASDGYVAITSLEPVDVATVLDGAGVAGAVGLGHEQLVALLAERVGPAAGTLLDCDGVARWHHLEAPTSVHAAFVIAEWPAGEVDEQVLAPLCLAAERRWVVLSVRGEELDAARRRTARVRTATVADEAVAGGAGFLASTEAVRVSARDAERADELAGGHGSLRVVGVVCLDAAEPLALEAAAARLVADATACGLRLRRCDGDHRRGVLASVPGWCRP